MKPGLAHGGDLTYRLIGLAMRVHNRLGPGLLESAYQRFLCHELTKAGIAFDQKVPIPIRCDDGTIETGYIADIIVRQEVIIELKSVDQIHPRHESQLLTYLRLSGCPIGLLINFNTVSLTEGILRRVLTPLPAHGPAIEPTAATR
ncbi:MAG: GxxExxY protein [Acetobacteraceae bacterium]|nr:GxxExxY protein [Acetobacteraceae bacterium]